MTYLAAAGGLPVDRLFLAGITSSSPSDSSTSMSLLPSSEDAYSCTCKQVIPCQIYNAATFA